MECVCNVLMRRVSCVCVSVCPIDVDIVFILFYSCHILTFLTFFLFFERIHYKNISTNLTHNSILVIFCIVCHII